MGESTLHSGCERWCRTDTDTDDLVDLPYLEHVIQEALRLYPPAFVLFRELTTDVEIGGYTIPEGSARSAAHSSGQCPRKDGEETDPRAEWPEYAYYPFGGGLRHCIGMRFATMGARLILVTLCQRFEFEPVTEPPLDLAMQVTLQPTDGIDVIPRAG